MNRRTLKKQIPHQAQRLVVPVRKYLRASGKVSRDVIYRYEKEIERVVLGLMNIHLILDPAWPHRKRWLDGLSEEFAWERKRGSLYGSGELFWGHWPEVSRDITGGPLTAQLRLCDRHGIEYRFTYDTEGSVGSYSSARWCSGNWRL